MNFIKKNWKKGNRLTVKELNRIENGIEEAVELPAFDITNDKGKFLGIDETTGELGWFTIPSQTVTNPE